MICFTIRDANSDAELRFSKEDSCSFADKGDCPYSVSFVSRALTANISVHDMYTQRWIGFFSSLSSRWRGWRGVQDCASLEKDVNLSASCDRVGHVYLHIVLKDCAQPTGWSAECSITLEAGQLESITKQAKSFFGRS